MCATIAAATRADGGNVDGVAPDAGVIACKTCFFEGELTNVYDYLTALATDRELHIIASNIFGINQQWPTAAEAVRPVYSGPERCDRRRYHGGLLRREQPRTGR